jgi:hypothetical protein
MDADSSVCVRGVVIASAIIWREARHIGRQHHTHAMGQLGLDRAVFGLREGGA